MKVVSVNVGLPREVTWRGKTVTTGIFKSEVPGIVAIRRHNLDGDQQADLSVHGGPTKAVYVYPSEHYEYWRRELPGIELTWGNFGENLTTDGLDEESLCIGDELHVGSARVVVTEPRMPCLKLGIRFNRPDMVKRFLKSQRTGFYFGVVAEGEVQAGDALELLRACKEITACTVDRRVVRCARGVGHPAGKACSAGARAHGAIAPGMGGD